MSDSSPSIPPATQFVTQATSQPSMREDDPDFVPTGKTASSSAVLESEASSAIVVEGPEQAAFDPTLPDGGLPLLPGVQSWCVMRATRDEPRLADDYGWTYHHHVDMATWHGRLYVGWNSCQKDEDVWPSRELYSTSTDGRNWSRPTELFPQGTSTPLRMYFFVAPNGHFLAIAGLRVDETDTDENTKGGLVVREILANHTLGPVYTLQSAPNGAAHGPQFDTSSDAGFVTACRELLTDNVYLEQQDLGRLLGARRMSWHDPASWPGGRVPGDNAKWVSGKAFSFYERPDGVIVGVSKMGWTTLSRDHGKTWVRPAVPLTLVTGKAKVWAQCTRDGRYVLVYNPTPRGRYPLVVVHSDDGIHFRDMRVVQGELPIQRYEGRFRSIGPQYIRGVSHWADDHSRDDTDRDCFWLVYSMSKEDIWVSRVPLPVGASLKIADDFSTIPAGRFLSGWRTYQPDWAAIDVVTIDGHKAIRLQDRNPYDYARIDRPLDILSRQVAISLDLRIDPTSPPSADFEIDLIGHRSDDRPLRLRLAGGLLAINEGAGVIMLPKNGSWFTVSVNLTRDVTGDLATVRTGGHNATVKLTNLPERLSLLTIRTGAFRGVGGTKPVEPGSDKPLASPATLYIARFSVTS